MTITNVCVGGVTPNSATVVGKVTGASVRLAVADNSALIGPAFYGPVVPTAQGIASLVATGLDPDSRYWYQLEEDSVLDTVFTGTFRTHPPLGEPADIVFGWSSCAGGGAETPGTGAVLAASRLSNHVVFDTIRSRALNDEIQWSFFAHLGDVTYYDLGSGSHGIVGGGSVANYRRMIDDVLLQPNQHGLYRNVPWVYQGDDHDRGPNDHDRTYADGVNFNSVYRERVPSYATPAGVGGAALYQSFAIGRTRFVLADVRSDRDPNIDPQGPTKTMLGQAQKDWMAGLLGSAQEQFLVWLMPDVWNSPAGASDDWDSFHDEQAEMISMFADLGWLDRMAICSGDVHTLAIDTGTNSPGGIPVFQAAALDATGTGCAHTQYDLGVSCGNNRYGTMRINDIGSQISVTGSGFIGSSLWKSHTFILSEPEPPVPPHPTPEPVAVAEIRTEVTWLGCDLTSGQIIAELPDITGQVSRVLGAYTSANLTIPIPLGGPAHIPLATVLQAIDPARTMVVAVVNDIPTWAGIALKDDGGTDGILSDGLVSLEGYLRHRFVRDHTWTQQDEASVIAAGLLGDAEAPINDLGGGIGLVIDAPPTGTLRDRTYLASDHKSVYDALSELMAVQDGPEWTIDLDWTDTTHTAIAKIARVRKRVGIAASPPTALFQTTADSLFSAAGSSEARYVYSRDRTDGRYANAVQAYSSGEGEDQPNSVFALDVDALATGAPIWELHFQPSSSITTQSVLDDHAAAKLALLRDGTNTWQITARWDTYPRYGVDWQLGDSIAWDLIGHRHPDPGVTGQGRAIGFQLDMQAGTIMPILQEEAT